MYGKGLRALSAALAIGMVALTVSSIASMQTKAASIGNDGYPYGSLMTADGFTLGIKADGASSYQWQRSLDKSTWEDIEGATAAQYRENDPVSGVWYRCLVDDLVSREVKAVYPGLDGRQWTAPCIRGEEKNDTDAQFARYRSVRYNADEAAQYGDYYDAYLFGLFVEERFAAYFDAHYDVVEATTFGETYEDVLRTRFYEWFYAGGAGADYPWYLTNDVVAYTVNGSYFDVAALLVKNGVSYMAQTAYGGNGWSMYSSTDASPSAVRVKGAKDASLDGLYVAFRSDDPYALTFEADLKETESAFAFGADTMAGNAETTGEGADSAVPVVVPGKGAEPVSIVIGASEADVAPVLTISPVTEKGLGYWIGEREEALAFGSAVRIDEPVDYGMTMSFTDVVPGGSVSFVFEAGN